MAYELKHFLNLRRPSEPLGPFDAKVSTLVGNTVITTPNMNVIYRPTFGTRNIHLRRDLRYGDDDFTLWPQPYMKKYCHHLVVPRKPEQEDDPFAILWWDPSPSDFVPEGDSTIAGLGKVSAQKLAALRIPYEAVRVRVKEFLKTAPEDHFVPVVDVAMRHALTRLQSLATSYKEMVYGVTEFQRFVLELTALLDYQLIFCPRAEQTEIQFHEPANVIGAFTVDPKIAQFCFQVGIPVWLCRPIEDFPVSTNILAVGDCRQPKDFVVLEEWPETPFPIIYSGPANDEQKVAALHKYTRTWLQYPDPFRAAEDPFLVGGRIPDTSFTRSFDDLNRGLPNVKSRSVISSSAPTSSSASSSRPISAASSPQFTSSLHKASVSSSLRVPNIKNNRSQRNASVAYPQGAFKRSKNGDRSKFVPVDSPFCPPTIPAWSRALRDVDISTPRPELPTSTHHDSGFIFPDGGLILGRQNDTAMAVYISHWLQSRRAWIYRVSRADSSARPLSNQQWRDILSGSFAKSRAQPTQNSRTSRRHDDIRQVLGNCTEESGLSTVRVQSVPLRWRDQELVEGQLSTPKIVQEIVWELYELNFRFELLALDQRARSGIARSAEEHDRRTDKVIDCFCGPDSDTHSLLVTDIPTANRGLAANDWLERLPYLRAMHRLMRSWSGDRPLGFGIGYKASTSISEEECNDLEGAIASYYTQQFFLHFGRAAQVPHRLP